MFEKMTLKNVSKDRALFEPNEQDVYKTSHKVEILYTYLSLLSV